LKVALGDILVVIGFAAIGTGLWMVNWRLSLVVMGSMMMVGGGMALRKGRDESIKSDI
jgi:uncharacterized membrane protein